MAKNRFPGRAGKFEVDVTGEATSFSQVTVARNIQLPGASKAFIDLMGMEDDDFQGEPGIEEESTWSLEVVWDPSDAQDESLRAAYEANTYCNFKVTFTDKDDTTAITTWNGYITGLEPVAVGGNDPVAMAVSGRRVGAITET